MTFPLPNFHTYISSTIDKIFRYKWTVIMANEVSMTLQKEWKLVEKDCSFLAFNICTSYHTFRVWMIFTGCLCLTWLNYAGKNLSYDLIKRLSSFQFNFIFQTKCFSLRVRGGCLREGVSECVTWRPDRQPRTGLSTGVTSHLVNRLASLHLHITYLSTLETEDRYNVQYIIYNIIYI